MRRLAAIVAMIVLVGAGCSSAPSTSLTVGAGDTLTIRETVLGIGGKIAEWFGAGTEAQTVVLSERVATTDATLSWKKANDWQTGAMVVDTSKSQFVLSSAQYDGLVTGGSTTLSLGLLDTTISGALAWTDSVKSFLSSVNQTAPDLPTATDVLTIKTDDLATTAWVRVDGTLQKVDALKASNWFAEYLVLKNADNPLILSVTLKPAADASFDSALRGFEVSEIKTTSP